MNFFTTPNSTNIIAALRIVTIKKSELTFLPTLYFLYYSSMINSYLSLSEAITGGVLLKKAVLKNFTITPVLESHF